MSTLKDVAMRAGVSIASVSTVVNGTAAVSPAMRERVERAVDELGYVPHVLARNLKLGRTRSIGLVLPDITNPHFSGLASTIEVALDQAGFTLTLCSTTDDPAKEASQLRAMRAQRVAGMIFIPGGRTQDTATLGALLKVPTVLLDRTLAGLDLDSVVLDNVMAGRLATDHLLDQGHRRIAVVAGSPNLALSRERVAGCRDAMLARDVPYDEALVADGGFQSEPSYRATLGLLCRRPRPSAIVAANNHGTVGVMMALRDRGLGCPRDVSVVGIDDFTWAEAFSPRLTAVAQPIVAMGREAVRLLLGRCEIADRGDTAAVVLQPRLIVRDSTRRPAASRRKSPLAHPGPAGSRSSSIP